MNLWEFLSQPVICSTEEYKIFWDAINEKNKNEHPEIHNHLHVHQDSSDKLNVINNDPYFFDKDDEIKKISARAQELIGYR